MTSLSSLLPFGCSFRSSRLRSEIYLRAYLRTVCIVLVLLVDYLYGKPLVSLPPIGNVATMSTTTPLGSAVFGTSTSHYTRVLGTHVSSSGSPRSSIHIDGEPNLKHEGQQFTVQFSNPATQSWIPTWLQPSSPTLRNMMEMGQQALDFVRWLWVGGDGLSSIQGFSDTEHQLSTVQIDDDLPAGATTESVPGAAGASAEPGASARSAVP